MALQPGRNERTLTLVSLAALASGLAIGALGQRSGHPAFAAAGDLLAPLGALWVSALQMVALPLVIAHVAASVASVQHTAAIGSAGVRAVLFFIAALVAGGLFTLVVAPPLIGFYPADPVNAELVRSTASIPDVARTAATVPMGSFGQWLGSLLPRNLFEAAAGGEVLGLLLFALGFGVAVRQLPDAQRAPIVAVLQGAASALLTMVRWLLRATPIGVLALTYGLALETGLGATTLLFAFVIIVSTVMLLFTALIYPVTAVLGGVTMRDFARAVAPAQLVAVSTRSSIAALPAMIEGATSRLHLPSISSSFILPLAVALFKPNRTISSTVKLLFVAHAFGVSLDIWTIATFLATVTLLSFSSVGVAGGGSAFKTLPAYLAAGLPIEGVVIMEVVETIPDIFKTVLNVTGNLGAATIVARGTRHGDATAVPDTPVPERAA